MENNVIRHPHRRPANPRPSCQQSTGSQFRARHLRAPPASCGPHATGTLYADCRAAVSARSGSVPGLRISVSYLVVLLFVLFAAGSYASVILDSTQTQYLYLLCRASPTCSTKFLMGQGSTKSDVLLDQARFDEAAQMTLSAHTGLAQAVLPRLAACTTGNDSTADLCALVQSFALQVLIDASACPHPNQYWELGTGCVCTQGKSCNDSSAGVDVADLWSYIVAMCVLAFLIAGLILIMSWDSQRLDRLMLEQKANYGNVLYYNAGLAAVYGQSTEAAGTMVL